MCQVYRRDEEEEKEEPEVRSSGADTWRARWHRFAVIFFMTSMAVAHVLSG
jgi:hypothetical protein